MTLAALNHEFAVPATPIVGISYLASNQWQVHGPTTRRGADADLTDAQLRALSGHKTASMTALYAKQTMKQRREGARKRLAARTKGPSR
jgi:hypothetical protein